MAGVANSDEGRVCEFYAGLLYRHGERNPLDPCRLQANCLNSDCFDMAGANGKILMHMSDAKLAELGIRDEGHITSVLNRCCALKGFLGRYIIEEGPPIYESKDTRVIRALDRLSSTSVSTVNDIEYCLSRYPR